jgi:hypothetical protein
MRTSTLANIIARETLTDRPEATVGNQFARHL